MRSALMLRLVLASMILGSSLSQAQTVVLSEGFNGSSMPWSEYHPSETSADWYTDNSSSCPPLGPREGTRMAVFNSCDAASGDEARITSDTLNLNACEVAELRFWMYHDTTYTSTDRVRFQITTDSWERYYTLQTLYRNDGSNGWKEVVLPLGYFCGTSDLKIAFRGYSRNGGNIYIDDLELTKDILAAGADGKGCSAEGDCDSNQCGTDPHGNRRCRGVGSDCVGAHRESVSAGSTVCAGLDVASCLGADSWSLTDCNDDCGPYLDVHGCEVDSGSPACAECDNSCIDLFGISEGCDANAYCEMVFIFGECHFKKSDGGACASDRECLSDNCVGAPGSGQFCEPTGTPCAGADGSAVSAGTTICANGDAFSCQSSGWTSQDCYQNCGFYDDVDNCQNGTCASCPSSCSVSDDCKPGILCVGNQCVGGLGLGETCTLDSQCDSDHCVDGHCCQDVCTAPCYACDLDNSGVCRAIPGGQDPLDECPGQGPCDGTCNGMGGCDYPTGTTCGVCARCNHLGQCANFVAAGTDPDGECPGCQVCSGSAAGCSMVLAGEDPLGDCGETAQSTCGQDGTCDGQGGCRNWPMGTECAGASCAAGILLLADTCDGNGLCQDQGSVECQPFRCADALACAQSCQNHSACIPEAFCSSAGTCLWDLGEGADCQAVVYPGALDDAACTGGFCFEDNFDGQGAFCTANAAGCVNDGLGFGSGYALCLGDQWYRVCVGGAPGWGDQVDCQAGTCDAGGGPGSGIRGSGSCTSGPGGGCSSQCQSCEPYLAFSDSSCRLDCSQQSDCWPGYDCQDGNCEVPEGLGEVCASQSDCRAGVCVDGRCCEDECVGACRACNLPGREGFCSMVSTGTDPDSDCPAELAETCGSTGVCDGSGGCQKWPAGQVCAPAFCLGNTRVNEATCDGAGNCASASQSDCRPGICSASGCLDSCMGHPDCDPTGYCASDGMCQGDLLDGQSCADVVLVGLELHPACLGGYCYYDSWSEAGSFCVSEVDACTAAGQQYQAGFALCSGDDWYRSCAGGEFGWGPLVDCSVLGVCDAGGGLGSGITPAGVCQSGSAAGCTSVCQSCYPYRAQAPGQCADMCGEDNDCWPGHQCVSGQCQADQVLGSACDDGSTCAGYECVDGVCCNVDCAGSCVICNDPLAYGICLNAAPGTDPRSGCEEGEGCGQTGLCDGLGQCALLAEGSECASATCAEGLRTSAALCDGLGNCQPGLEHDCPSGECLDQNCAPTGSDGGVADGQDGADGDHDGGDVQSNELRAEAGPVQVVSPGQQVTLDGSASTGPATTTLSFLWQLSSGPEDVALSGSTTPGPSFVAGREGVYVFQLVVSAGDEHSGPDFTEIHVISGSSGCACGTSGGTTGLLLTALPLLWLWRRRRSDPC